MNNTVAEREFLILFIICSIYIFPLKPMPVPAFFPLNYHTKEQDSLHFSKLGAFTTMYFPLCLLPSNNLN